AVRHGLEDHRDRALDLLHAATQRFSMEFYVRPFLNRWPEETMARLRKWTADPNYHVRRLVSEGTRARLPWATRIDLDPMAPLPLLDALHADPTRYVTRSVANHLGDIAKLDPNAVLDRLATWRAEGRQDAKELAWMERHALRHLIKQGNPDVMVHLGYRADAEVMVSDLKLTPSAPTIGDVMEIAFNLTVPADTPVIVDYAMHFLNARGEPAPKVFKIKDTTLTPGKPLHLTKRHRFKGDATTFTLRPGQQRLTLHINGTERAAATFDLRA
ncbi:MAG: hypothetical protein ACU0CI_10615, partial [Shimia sp.]